MMNYDESRKDRKDDDVEAEQITKKMEKEEEEKGREREIQTREDIPRR